ncbi:MAG: c-type cytochrome [Proteobacteria bacterium]|nr:c-type cytochrome [Pseudomonadota bacterium]
MKTLKNILAPGAAVVLVATTLILGTSAAAAPAQIKLPGETVKLRPSKLPGYALAMQKCASCHSADYIAYQAPNLTLAQWTGEVQKMKGSYGAPLDDGDVKQIGAYLAVAYGSAKADDPAVIAASAPAPTASPPAAQGAKVDVKNLLASNACLSCHGLQQQIVGPGFNDVAKKYKASANGQSMLENSIRTGSTGKWGSGTMPPFAALKPEELKALSAFVLEQ